MRKATTADTIEFEVKGSKASSEVKEQKGFDGKEMVLYPSGKYKIHLSLIDLGENADWVLNDSKGKDNPNKTVFTVNSLYEPFKGSRKVKSARRLIQYLPKEDVVRNGNVVAKKGEISSYYDKYGKCMFTDLNKEWDLHGDKNKYRLSGAETYLLAYIHGITDIEKLEKKEINQVALVGFNVMDIYSLTAKFAVGKKLEKYLSEDENGDIDAKTYSFTYTKGDLDRSKKEMNKTEQAIIDDLRSRKDELMEEYKHLLPIEYKVLEEAVKNGDYVLQTPNSVKPSSNGTKVSFGNNMEDDLPPF